MQACVLDDISNFVGTLGFFKSGLTHFSWPEYTKPGHGTPPGVGESSPLCWHARNHCEMPATPPSPPPVALAILANCTAYWERQCMQ